MFPPRRTPFFALPSPSPTNWVPIEQLNLQTLLIVLLPADCTRHRHAPSCLMLSHYSLSKTIDQVELPCRNKSPHFDPHPVRKIPFPGTLVCLNASAPLLSYHTLLFHATVASARYLRQQSPSSPAPETSSPYLGFDLFNPWPVPLRSSRSSRTRSSSVRGCSIGCGIAGA